MIYLDTSCLIKLIRLESASGAVAEAVGEESGVIVSALAELEASIELKAGYLAGDYSLAQWRKLETQLNHLRNEDPFIFKGVPAAIWETALRQHGNSGKIHYRTLDRLHLAAVEHFGLSRIMTHDKAQAKAAQALDYEVVKPGEPSV